MNIDKDQRALRLAKIALGWDELTMEQQMDLTRELLQRAQEIKQTLQ